MKRLFITTALLLISFTVHAGSVVRCEDPNTGAVTFTDGGCQGGAASEKVEVFQGNTMDSRQARKDIQRLEAVRMQKEARRLEKRRRMENLQRYQAQQQAAKQKKALCDKITRPHKGAQNGQLTAAQRDAMMRCAGISVPERNYGSTLPTSIPAPATPPSPSHITNCDASGMLGQSRRQVQPRCRLNLYSPRWPRLSNDWWPDALPLTGRQRGSSPQHLHRTTKSWARYSTP